MKLLTALITFAALQLIACDKQGDDNADSNGESPADMAGGPELHWYSTCGDPACSGYNGPWEGVPACGNIQEGDVCQTEGESCDFMSDCNAQMVCAASDPKQQPGGCPISRSRFKQDIDYVDAAERDTLYRALLELKLANYRYRERSDGKLQLGIILEDQRDEPWVDPANDRVDLYGYSSLAIAGVQAQAQELAAMRAELEAMRRELDTLRDRCE
jgi:hypothetical protein